MRRSYFKIIDRIKQMNLKNRFKIKSKAFAIKNEEEDEEMIHHRRRRGLMEFEI